MFLLFLILLFVPQAQADLMEGDNGTIIDSTTKEYTWNDRMTALEEKVQKAVDDIADRDARIQQLLDANNQDKNVISASQDELIMLRSIGEKIQAKSDAEFKAAVDAEVIRAKEAEAIAAQAEVDAALYAHGRHPCLSLF